MNLLEATFEGASVTVSSEVAGPVTFDLSGVASGPPSALMQWLKPSITFTRGGMQLYKFEPYGTPQPIDWGWWILIASSLALLLLLRK